MTDTREFTERGFRVFAVRERLPEEVLYCKPESVSVVESSIAGRGAHVRIYEGAPATCTTCPTRMSAGAVQLNVTEAAIVCHALATFISESEADLLTEPAPRDAEDT